jgi:hypothetical protein
MIRFAKDGVTLSKQGPAPVKMQNPIFHYSDLDGDALGQIVDR